MISKLFQFRKGLVFSLGLVLIVGMSVFLITNFLGNNQPKQARANEPSIVPAMSGFPFQPSWQYLIGSDSATDRFQVRISILDNRLSLDRNFGFRENFDKKGFKCINLNLFSNNVLIYQPNSAANSTTNNCQGTSTPGNPLQNAQGVYVEKTAEIVWKINVAADVPDGTTIGSRQNPAIKAELLIYNDSFPNGKVVNTDIWIVNVRNSNQAVKFEDVESVVCTPNSVDIGTPVQKCEFILRNPEPGKSYFLPTGTTAQINSVPTNTTSCTLAKTADNKNAIVCSNLPTTGGTPGNQPVRLAIGNSTPQNTKGTVTLTVKTKNIEPTDITSVVCTPSSVQIGNNVEQCVFTLKPESVYNQPNNLTASIATTNGNSQPCTLSGNQLICKNLPTTGGSPGNQIVRLNFGNNPQNTNGVVTLINPSTELLMRGRLYFKNKADDEVKYDELVRYNVNYKRQTYKQASIFLVYDQIGEDPKQLWNSGKCTFKLFDHPTNNLIYTLTGNISNGQCMVELTVDQQINARINYYIVRVEATREGVNRILYDVNIANLYVGLPRFISGSIDLGGK